MPANRGARREGQTGELPPPVDETHEPEELPPYGLIRLVRQGEGGHFERLGRPAPGRTDELALDEPERLPLDADLIPAFFEQLRREESHVFRSGTPG